MTNIQDIADMMDDEPDEFKEFDDHVYETINYKFHNLAKKNEWGWKDSMGMMEYCISEYEKEISTIVQQDERQSLAYSAFLYGFGKQYDIHGPYHMSMHIAKLGLDVPEWIQDWLRN